jgi:cell division protein ZapA (FtsZ GTPase activity inhibitor)
MAADESIIVRVPFSGSEYPVRFVRGADEEGYIRKVKDTIEQKISQYKERYPVNGTKNAEGSELGESDYIKMMSIQAVFETIVLESKYKKFEDQIKQLINELDTYLES